jgi:hypothetical protein
LPVVRSDRGEGIDRGLPKIIPQYPGQTLRDQRVLRLPVEASDDFIAKRTLEVIQIGECANRTHSEQTALLIDCKIGIRRRDGLADFVGGLVDVVRLAEPDVRAILQERGLSDRKSGQRIHAEITGAAEIAEGQVLRELGLCSRRQHHHRTDGA